MNTINDTSGIIVHCVADHLPFLQVCKFGKLKICSVPKTRSFALCNIQKFKFSRETADISDIFDRRLLILIVALKCYTIYYLMNLTKTFLQQNLLKVINAVNGMT